MDGIRTERPADTVASLRARERRPLHPGKTLRELGATERAQIARLLQGPPPRIRPVERFEEGLRGPEPRASWRVLVRKVVRGLFCSD